MASEVIALCHSFEQELAKSLNVLPPVSASKPDAHDAHLNHHRLSQRIAESVSYYAGRLPAYASVPRILAFGDKLFRAEQYQLALQACYKHVRGLGLHSSTENLPRMDAQARLSSHVQACFGCAACEAALLLASDGAVKHPDTLQWLVSCLTQLRAALTLALPDERLYWLVLNGTVHVYGVAKAMITAGFAEQALPALVFCIKALEGHVAFAAPKYLPWRTQLYTWAVYGLADCGAVEQARALLADGLKRLEVLVALQKLDPVPAAPAVQAAFAAARGALVGLQLRVEVAAGAPVAPVLAQLSAGAAGAGAVGAAGPTARAGLAALVEALHVPHRRVVRTEAVSSGPLKELFDAAMAAAAPLIEGLKKATEGAAAADAAAAAAAAAADAANAAAETGTGYDGAAPADTGAQQQASAAAAAADEAAVAAGAALAAAQEALPCSLHKGLLCAAYNLEQWKQFEGLASLATTRSDVVYADALPTGTGSTTTTAAAADMDQTAVQLGTAASILTALRQLSTAPGVDSLRTLASVLQLALSRGVTVSGTAGAAPPPPPRRVSVTGMLAGGSASPPNGNAGGGGGAATLTATAAGITQTGGSPAPNGNGAAAGGNGGGSAAAAAGAPPRPQQSSLAPWQQLRDLIADASLALYGSARPLIDGVFCADDKEAGLVAELLAACHAAWAAVELDDGELRVAAALKLALLLEEEGRLLAAREVLLQAKSVVQQARVELMAANKRAPDEHVRWVTASRSQPSDDTAALVQGMTASEQELACLQVDVLALLARVELGLGVAEQQGRATARRTAVLEEQAKRTAQSSIFGQRNAAELARDEARLVAAGATPPNPQMKERELLAACGKNPYERAVVLMQMTAFQGADAARKAQLLQEAGDLLTKAQAAEDGLFAAQQPDLRARRDVPPQPKLLQRSPTSVTLVAHPPGPGLKQPPGARKPPSRYVAYCKSFGAGVGLSINKTATEYPGSGVSVPLGQPVTIQGLRTNDTYLLAVALYDDDGNIVGGLGTSTPEVLVALPLPLLMCWAHLLAAAVRCGAAGAAAAKRAASVLLPHFVVTTPDVPLWRSNPMESQRLHRAHVAAAARPLLRALVQAIYLYGGAALLRTTGGGGGGSTAPGAPVPQVALPCTLPQLRAPFLEEQVARLKSARLLVLGMEVAALLPDEPLMQEGALRTYGLLAPLLALRAPRSHLLHKALAACHAVLASLTNLVQDSLYRQEHQRSLAARVAAAVTYQLLRLSDEAGEGGAAAHFGKLQLELLKAYDPRFALAGRSPLPPGAELQEEASQLHDVLLQHPKLTEWAPEPLAERLKDGSDLTARVLPVLGTAAPMDAWGQALGFETAAEHPRWVELVVRMIEAAVRKGNPGNAAVVAEQLSWWVRARLRRPPPPPLDAYEAEAAEAVAAGGTPPPWPAKWKLEEAAAALDAAAVAASHEPPLVPSTEGMTPEDASNALAQHASAVAAAEAVARRRLAAVLLLQKRLPGLLARKRQIERMRENRKRWSPWMARLNLVLGLQAAAEARRYAANAPARARARAAAAEAAAAAAPAPEASGVAGLRPGTAGYNMPPPPMPDPPAAGPPPLTPPDGITPPLQAMMHFARAAHLAARGGAWVEVGNAARHAWNLARATLSADPALTAPLPRVRWERGDAPQPAVAPESILVPAGAGDKKGGKKGGKDDKKKEERAPPRTPPSPKAGARSSARSKKGLPVEEAPPPPRTYPVVVGARPNMQRAARSLADAVLGLVSLLRDGLQVYTWVAPVNPRDRFDGPPPRRAALAASSSTAGAGLALGEEERPVTARVTDSEFSYGSDLQADIWFKEGPLDLAWVSRFLGLAAVVLSRGERWHSLLEAGRQWARLSEGVFNERIMPWLLQAAPKAGVDPAPFQSAMDALIRDKNQALDQLDKVRTLVRERLGDSPLMAQGMGHKVRKRKSRAAALAAGPGSGAADGGGSGLPDSDRASLVSAAYTYRTASTYKTKASQPDFLRIPGEYEKVIEVLKRRNEKGAMLLALHELGDVHAHFGNWGGAATSWNDTLDTLLGPYQALRNWRGRLDGMSPAATLQAYGLHGLLLGCVVAGKLARYVHHDNLHLRLEAHRLAARLAFCAFAAHLGHPQRRAGFATYTPRELWAAGADAWLVWSDPYRCPVVDLAGALEGAAAALLDAGLALEALPVLALWEHVARYVLRSLHGTVLCRLLRVRALVALGLLAEAVEVAGGLMGAAGLPDPTLDSDYVLKDTSGAVVEPIPVLPYDNALLPGEPGNKAALTHIADTPLAPAVEKLYGSWLVAHLALARAQILMLAGGVPNQWRGVDWRTGERTSAPKPASPAKGAAKGAAAAAPEAPGAGLPEPVEPAMLERANVLLRKALAMASGDEQPPSEESSSAGKPAGAGKPAPARAPSPGRAKSPTSKGKGKAGDDAGGAAAAPREVPGPPPPPPPSASQRAEVNVRALLLLCELEQLRWMPGRGLAHALEAARFLGEHADRVNTPQQGDNDELERHSLAPSLWFLARAAAVRCAAVLGHAAHVHDLVAAATGAHAPADPGSSSKVPSGLPELLHCTGMAHVAALTLAAEGRTAEALAALAAVAARYRSLSVYDGRLAAALLDAAALRDRLGLRADAAELAAQGLAVAEGHCMELGLGEALEAPELTNIYLDGTSLYAHALGAAAVHASRRQQHAEAERCASRAVLLLRSHTRALPATHAAALLLLGRTCRMVALCGDGVPVDGQPTLAAGAPPASTATLTSAGTGAPGNPAATAVATGTARAATAGLGATAGALVRTAAANHGGGSPSSSAGGVAATAAKLSAARAALCASITLAAVDGGHLRSLMRGALLELGSIFIAGLDARSAATCLRAAHAAAAKADLVALSSHTLAPVAAAQLPEWALVHVRGQEALFGKKSGGAAAVPAAVSTSGARPPATPQGGKPAAGSEADADAARMVFCLLGGLLKGLDSLPVGGGARARGEAQVAALHAALRAACAKYGTDACFAEPPLPASPPDAAPAPPEGSVLAQWHCQDGCWQEARSWRADGSSGAPDGPLADAALLGLQPVPAYASLLFVVAAPSHDGSAGPHCGEVTFAVKDVRELQRRVKGLRARMEAPKAATDILGHAAPSQVELGELLRAAERLLSAVPRSSEDGSSSAGFSAADSGLNGFGGSELMEGEVRPQLDQGFLCKLEALLALEAGLDVSDKTLGSWLVQTLPVVL
ncbi:hypothetical protein HYH02_001857 [Chlamydomonas schloesseri]|uniref:Uncharacterized protein n=1 Tax=Chlamydomonas schloesseri TaxID=2026947 RepID=A0A835WSZ1_9CHLO|nr:hypothetical protein HYH02_001857 [Chlamydomonas schloesseri]|eukprot:KAG2453644.1 hypothetical protein HYH02_001857 [Chlamydomonas schloesseri]